MLEGAWGSGKSFFVDNYLKDRLSKARVKDPKAKEEIRLSLFGVSDLGEITSQIFAKAHPRLSGKTAKFVNVIASKAVSAFGVSADPKENAQLLQDTLLNLEGRVLVFDDFERCPMPVIEVMGYINRFVEQDKLKVIVIASEDDIDQKKEYDERKEKLIGKTIRVGSDPGTVLDAFAINLQCSEAKAALAANREDALSTFTARGHPNFRSLRAILSDYDRVVSAADPKLRASDDAMGALLLYMIAIGVEYRGGGIDTDGMRSLTNDVLLRLNLDKAPISEGRKRGAELRDTYPLVSWRDPIVLPELLAELFSSGMIDVAILDAHLLQHPRVVGHAEVPKWRAMWEWYDMGETEYRQVRDAFADQLITRSIVHPGELLHAIGTSIRLQGYGDDLLSGMKPKAFFKEYLADIEANETLFAVPKVFDSHGGSHGGLVYNESDTESFAEIREMVRAATMKALSRRTARESVKLLKRLQADPTDGTMLHEWGLEKEKYAGVAILHHIPVTDLADLLLVDSKFNDHLLAALKARYEFASASKDLNVEKSWLRALRAELVDRLKTVNSPYRSFGEARLAYWFSEMAEWATPVRKPRAEKMGSTAAGTAKAAATRRGRSLSSTRS